MDTTKLTREEALRRWNASKENKRKMVEKLENLVRKSCLERTGKEPIGVEVWQQKAAINANSPYEVKVALADDTLCFITDYDAEIFVTFERDDILHNGLVYQFGISNPKGVKSPRDPKVRETILAIVEEFFAKNNAAFLYICDTSGGMQKMRNRLFKYWFGIYGERKEYVFLPQTITDEEGNDNYAALIIRKDNPQFADLVSEFMATVNLLNTKPEDYDEQIYIIVP